MTHGHLEIRLTTTADWQRLKQVRLAALRDAPMAFGVSFETAARYSDEQWQQRAASSGTAFWLATLDGETVGMVGAAAGAAGGLELIGMWTAPAARGRGVAQRLVDAVKARALAQGHDRVSLEVSPENASAVRLYRRQGFVFIDRWEALESHPHIRIRTMVWNPRRTRALKALSIVSPNGGRIASGQKTLEVRRWHPHLAPSEDLLIVENTRFLRDDGDEDDGLAVAIVRVKAVRPFVEADVPAACASYFAEGWLAWELEAVRAIDPPVAVRAARGIYEVDLPEA